MRTGQSRSMHMVAMLVLTLGAAIPACQEDQYPVLPSSPSHRGGLPTSSRIDGGGQQDTRLAGDAVANDAVTLTDADVSCDLLDQAYCATTLGPVFGCYPSGGVGRCVQGGVMGSLGTCLVDTDCAPGLLCDVLSGLGTFGLCQPICPLSDVGSAVCGAGAICRPLAGFQGTNAGRCSPA